jgi:O-methyltransferase
MNSLVKALHAQVLERTTRDERQAIALLGLSPTAIELLARLREDGFEPALRGIFDPNLPEGRRPLAQPWPSLPDTPPDLLVICSDVDKEPLLRAAAHALDGSDNFPEVVLAGTAHLGFHDPAYDELDAPALVPSYATGHPHTRIHIYQCLKAAAAQGLKGAIVEFGAFKGGTTAWLARVVAQLGLRDTPVIGFDTWDGFPPRRSLLDLYEHPRCAFDDLEAARAYVKPLGVELVVGDIFDTAPRRLHDEPILLCFFDTDNYSGARVALETTVPNLVAGGALVFDHFATSDEYVYTIGERMAAHEVLEDAGLLHVHGTGVFVKLR